MATSSSLSAAASFLPKRNDVFISFRGEDTRKGFISHLRDALIRKQIQTYVDDRLNKGDEISPSLFKAIGYSHISIIVFSEKYATSKWCLDELVKILECRKEGQEVIPVFYEVDPSNIRKLKRSYEEAFAKHECDFCNDQDKLTKWKQALFEAANLSGWDSRIYQDESKLLQEIVEDVLKKLEYKYQLKESKYLSGINENLAPVESLLREFQIIGIWGMGGIGKTTIAKWFFDKYSSQFEGSCLLRNIRERFGNDGQALRAELVSKLLDGHERIYDVESCAVRRRLNCERVFVVLDDVSASKQFECLVEELQPFGSGSWIIITTRDKHVLESKEVKMHNVKALNFQESLQLFCLNAFSQNCPKMDYEKLSKRAVDYSKGTPLVLKVLGSFLHSKTRNEWECALKKIKRIPNNEIHSVLKLSYDGLDHDESEIFLDIACFLKGMCKDNVVSLLDSFGFYADIGLRTLQDKALITIEYGTVQMHDLIQEMGWKIVRQESINELGDRSRLCDPKEIYDVLKDNRWDGCPSKNLPLIFCPQNLVELLMPDSKLEKLWDGVQDLCNLKIIDFSGSERLVELPDFSMSPNLEEVDLSYCTSLRRVHPSILSLHSLVILKLYACLKLKSLESKCHLRSLETLDLGACARLKKFSVSSEKMRSLDLGDTSIEMLPSSIGCLKRLEYLETSCRVKNLPNELSCLRHLKELVITFAMMLMIDKQELQEIFNGLQSLEKLRLRYCRYLLELPDNIGELSSLRSLDLSGSNIERLPESIKQLTKLEDIPLYYCEKLGSLPDLPQSIRYINLRGSSVESLPTNIKQLTNLKELDLYNCERLQSIPKLPKSITSFHLSGSKIKCWSKNINKLTKLTTLSIGAIKGLPASFKQFERLSDLSLTDCEMPRSCEMTEKLPQSIKYLSINGSNIECLPPTMRHFTKLESLHLDGNKRLRRLPELPQSIKYLSINGSEIECLPSNINQLTKLGDIELRDCYRLRTLPELPQSLYYLDVTNCTSLETVNSTLWEKKRKLSLVLRNCVNLDEHVLSSILESTYSFTKENYLRDYIACLPGRRVPKWFKANRTIGDSITIELDPALQLESFAFSLVLSPCSSSKDKCTVYVRCSHGFDVHIPYQRGIQGVEELNSDHVYVWPDSNPLTQIDSNPLNELKSISNLSFEAGIKGGNENLHPGVRIKEFGVCPIYRNMKQDF